MHHHRIVGFLIAAMLSLWATVANAQSFKIYFSRDMSELAYGVEENIAAIVGQASADHPLKITIVGHTDNAERNGKALSLKRAKTVKAALLAQHLPAGIKIVVKGVGATQPALATSPNVSEPLNRFVEVSY